MFKIDGMFVCDMEFDLINCVVVCVIIEVGCELYMMVVVEWVELVDVVC